MVNHKRLFFILSRSILQQFIKFYCPNQRGTCMFVFGSEFVLIQKIYFYLTIVNQKYRKIKWIENEDK